MHRLPDPEETPLVTVPDAGAWLGLGRTASYDAARRGELPIVLIGSRRFVPVAELRSLVGLMPSTSDVPDDAPECGVRRPGERVERTAASD